MSFMVESREHPESEHNDSTDRTIPLSHSPPIKRKHRWGKIVFILFLILTPCALGILWYYYYGPGKAPQNTLYMVPMRDGVRLATAVYLPEGNGPFPIVLYRTPYNKDHDPGPLDYRKYGVGIVSQDHRGCHASEGKYTGFGSDGADANDTIEWLKTQPWFNGFYASYGGSARGITQYMQVPFLDDLRCQYIEVATSDLFGIAMFQGGAPRKMLAENWLTGIGQADYYAKIFEDLSPDGPFAVDHRIDSWEWDNVTWPAIHRGGWFDCFGQGTINGFMGYQYFGGEGGRGQSKLIMGPWTHDLGNNKPGNLLFPTNAKSDPTSGRLFEAMFAERLLNTTAYGDYRTMPNVTYYVMGDTHVQSALWNRWATADGWPIPHTNRTLYFQANSSLAVASPTDAKNFTYLFDPKNPVATLGGANLRTDNRGSFDQREIETGRSDILHFDYPVTEPFLFTGNLWAHLFVTSNCTDTDFTVKLMDVAPDGSAWLLCDGIVRMRYREGMAQELFLDGSNQTVYDAWVDLWSTSYYFNTGHTLRVAVSSSNYPRFDVNPNTGGRIQPVDSNTPVKIAQNSVIVSAVYPSAIILPIPNQLPNYV
jgi:predicted acyl esterase